MDPHLFARPHNIQMLSFTSFPHFLPLLLVLFLYIDQRVYLYTVELAIPFAGANYCRCLTSRCTGT